ncbi:putative PH-response regulator protein palH/RIM21 [Seiridium unicorne]|uniref:PH-response regulator protein palH/RIM21 n=1 Tax=Seiridium unicorne TaxID=138068 RepID=A0ABR2VAT9_9PEZI
MEARHLWSATAVNVPRSDPLAGCSSFELPANGVLTLSNGETITLAADAVFQPACTTDSVTLKPAIIGNNAVSIDETTSTTTGTSDPQFSDFRDPFYASTFPQCYALAATTIISYTLVIMLFIAPRSSLDGGVVVLGRRGFTNGPSSGTSIGGRPWLQKVAALTVAISLTIATADTFRVAEDQYATGIQNASVLQNEVLDGTQLKVIRLISDTFLWLAQAQTLIRLFPRQREKVIIKWTAFSLITLDVVFGALNSFLYDGPGNVRPSNFTDAVPALSYLFQLSLGLLYAAWVIYYSFMKKRYAYYHPLMRNISLVAMLSIVSILVPVVFFILDISKPDFTGWGDYVRWVGAAAASVIVWEWVERIEALEREEKKDGILGREVFDGDEMMDGPGTEFTWPRRRRTKKTGDDEDGGESGHAKSARTSSTGRSNMWPAMSSIASRYMSRSNSNGDGKELQTNETVPATGRPANRFLQPPLWISRPPPAVTPPSRTDTASADSTVYAVRYQPLTESTSRTTDERPISRSNSRVSSDVRSSPTGTAESNEVSVEPTAPTGPGPKPQGLRSRLGMKNCANAPPAEVAPHTQKPQPPRREYESRGWWDIRDRFEDFAATQAERIREKMRPTPDTESLEVVVIPPPPRRGAALAQVLEEEEREAAASSQQLGVNIEPTITGRTMRNANNPAATTVLSPLNIRSNSNGSNSSRPMLSPTSRTDTFQLRTWRQDSLGSPVSPVSPRTRPGENVGNAPPVSPLSPSAPRRAVDDVFQDRPSQP